jgi:hypothetical protein
MPFLKAFINPGGRRFRLVEPPYRLQVNLLAPGRDLPDIIPFPNGQLRLRPRSSGAPGISEERQ